MNILRPRKLRDSSWKKSCGEPKKYSRTSKNGTRPDLQIEEIYEYDKHSKKEDLTNMPKRRGFVFHLEGVNRPKDNAKFKAGNFGFSGEPLDALKPAIEIQARVMLASPSKR